MFENEVLTNNRKWIKPLIFGVWSLSILIVALIIWLFASISADDLPSFQDLENPKYDLASVVYDRHGEAFGKYYIENREEVKFEEISPSVVDALISTEDFRFRKHSGIDFRALFRVGIKTVLLRKSDSGGGSTISQQLAKLLYRRQNTYGMSSVKRGLTLIKTKLKEWITAVKLEKSYTKDEIIAMYLNKFEFINGAHGIVAASQIYFGKDQMDLTEDELAVLIGMLKNPSLYNPARFPEKSKNRRNVVLSQMLKYGKIDQLQYDSLTTKELNMDSFKKTNQSDGSAAHFRAELTKWLKKLFSSESIKKSDSTEYNIYTDGLKIYTTIDLDLQKHAEQAVREHMKSNQERFFRVWKGRNPWTHDADSAQRKIRANALKRRTKASDRYHALHDKYLGDIKAEVQDKFGKVSLSENVLKSLDRVAKGNRSIDRLITAEVIDQEEKDTYLKIIDSEYWPKLMMNFVELEIAFEEEFDREVEMQVFEYNENGFVDTTMTPLDSVKYHNKILQAGLLSVEPQTGYIRAWVGGVDHRYFKFDNVNSRRQVGSTIKPFVYTAAMSLQGISPCQEYEDIQYSIVPGDASFYVDEEWSPSNANGQFTGNMYNLYQGLLYSKNSITVRLVKEMGTVSVIRELLDNAGIKKETKHPNGMDVVPEVPSICLGAVDLTLTEMAGAYTTFANEGEYTEPIFIDRIEDKNGKVIYRGIPSRKQAINPLYNHIILDMLKNNVGGGFGLGVESEVGGKTGTTNDYTDAWFMGVTPTLVTGIWVGGEDTWMRFLSLENGQGFVMARPIFQKYLKAIEADPECEYDETVKFVSPPSGFQNLIDCERYKQGEPEDELNQSTEEKALEDEFEEEFEDEFEEEGN